MKFVHVEKLQSKGSFSRSREWKRIRSGLLKAVRAVDWPPGTGKFTIHPQSGKWRGEGNGVKPIKNECLVRLRELGWQSEVDGDVPFREIVDKQTAARLEDSNTFRQPSIAPFKIIGTHVIRTLAVLLPEIEGRIGEDCVDDFIPDHRQHIDTVAGAEGTKTRTIEGLIRIGN